MSNDTACPPIRGLQPACAAEAPWQDRAFVALQGAYRPHGGLLRLRGLAVARMCGMGWEAQAEALVAAGTVFGFHWYDAVWVPLFQFDWHGGPVSDAPRQVTAQWGCHGGGWTLASWYVQPNTWLQSERPIDCLGARLPAVLEAARADCCGPHH